MLLDGIDHVAILTNDTKRLCDWYGEIFGAVVEGEHGEDEHLKLTFLRVGPQTEFNIFEVDGNEEAARQTPMFGRGRIDHMGLQAASQEAFDLIRDRLIACGATDGFVTDFGVAISLFFIDPDGLEGEVVLDKPGTGPGDMKPPGTPAEGYERVLPEL